MTPRIAFDVAHAASSVAAAAACAAAAKRGQDEVCVCVNSALSLALSLFLSCLFLSLPLSLSSPSRLLLRLHPPPLARSHRPPLLLPPLPTLFTLSSSFPLFPTPASSPFFTSRSSNLILRESCASFKRLASSRLRALSRGAYRPCARNAKMR